MLINDLPPHVLSLALRRFNNQEVQEQTLGDKLTIRDIKYTSINLSCPVSLSSFKLSATGLAGGRSTGI
ncbi:MAG: hypothetical protein MJ224_00065 [archaeon]|nr:hypothetical protein [archaeon]